MPSIDNRIVEMQFNNAQFEQGVNQSLGTLDKLKSALKLDNASKGFDNINSAVNKLDFSGLSSAVMSVSLKFSVLELAAMQALTKIISGAVDAGFKFAKSLSVDQVIAGWNKFADKAQSVNTIMAATEESVEVVGAQLDKLNRYTDETSASFTDMTSNIGKFTNAGVGLEDAAQAMQGITNWAYLSGASVNEAGRAMYNLSQAMGIGAVTRIDWKSIENANMSTTKFKKTVIDTAVAMGTLKDKGNGAYKTLEGNDVSVTNFAEGLKDRWFTSEVLTATLDKFGSFSTDIINLADSSGITVTKLMRHFKEFENNTIDFEKIAAGTGLTAEEVRTEFFAMGTAYGSIAKRLVSQNKAIQRSASKIKDEAEKEEYLAQKTQEASDALKDYIANYDNYSREDEIALANKLGIEYSKLGDIISEMSENQKLGVEAFRAAQEYRSLKDAVDATIDAVSTGWMKIFELIFGNAEEAKQIWSSIGDTLFTTFAEPLETIKDLLGEWHKTGGYESFVGIVENLGEAFTNLNSAIAEPISRMFGFGDAIEQDEEGISTFGQKLVNLTEKFERFSEKLKIITSGKIENPLEGLEGTKIAKDLDGISMYEVADSDKAFYEGALSTSERLFNVLEALANTLYTIHDVVRGIWIATEPIRDFAGSVGRDILDLIQDIAAALLGIDTENDAGFWAFFTNIKEKIGPPLEWAAGIIHSFIETLGAIINPEKEGSFKDFGETFSEIFGKIGEVCKKVFPILSAIGRTIGTAIDIIVDKISEFAENASIQDFFELLKGGASVGIFTGLAKVASNIAGASGNLKDGGLLGLIFGSGGDNKGGIKETIKNLPEQIGEFAKRIGDSVKKFVDVEAFKAFGSALLMIAGALFILSMIPTESLGESLSLLALSMAAIVGVMELFAKSSAAESGKMLAAGVAFALLAGSLLILSAALLVFSLIPADKVASGLGAMAGVLTEVGIALAAMQLMDPGKLLASALAMLILAPALLLMAAALAVLALIPAERAATALGTLTGLLIETVAALAVLSLAGPMAIAAAAALLILSPALILMAAAIAILAAIPADKAATSVGILLGVLLELVGALGVLSLIGPMVLVAAAALLILSPALILIATALLLLSLIPMEAVGTALIALGGALMIVVAAAWAVAPVVGPLLALAVAFLAIAAATVVLGVGLTAIAAGIIALVAAGSILVTVVVGAFESLITSALALVTNLFQLGADILQAIIDGIKSMIGDLPQVAQDIINGLVQGLLGMMGSVLSAAAEIGRGILGSIKGALGIASPSKEMISLMGYVGRGLEIGSEKVIDKAAQIGNAIGYAMADGTQEGLSGINDLYGSPTIRPITDLSNIQNGSFNGFGIPGAYTSNAIAGIGTGIDAYRYGSQTTTNNSPVFNIYQQPGQDPEALARIINRELGRMYVR